MSRLLNIGAAISLISTSACTGVLGPVLPGDLEPVLEANKSAPVFSPLTSTTALIITETITTFAFRVSDADNPPSGPTMTTGTSSESLCPSSGISLEPSGDNWNLNVELTPELAGVCEITVEAFDGKNTSSQSFRVDAGVRYIGDFAFFTDQVDSGSPVSGTIAPFVEGGDWQFSPMYWDCNSSDGDTCYNFSSASSMAQGHEIGGWSIATGSAVNFTNFSLFHALSPVSSLSYSYGPDNGNFGHLQVDDLIFRGVNPSVPPSSPINTTHTDYDYPSFSTHSSLLSTRGLRLFLMGTLYGESGSTKTLNCPSGFTNLLGGGAMAVKDYGLLGKVTHTFCMKAFDQAPTSFDPAPFTTTGDGSATPRITLGRWLSPKPE